MLARELALALSSCTAFREKWNTRSLIAGEGVELNSTRKSGTIIGGRPLCKWWLKSGGWETFSIPLQISDQAITKFKDEVPSATEWLMEQLRKTPSASSVTAPPPADWHSSPN